MSECVRGLQHKLPGDNRRTHSLVQAALTGYSRVLLANAQRNGIRFSTLLLLPHLQRCGGTLDNSLIFRLPLLVAYICVGALLGPYGLAYISDASLLTDIAEFGIIFLLFLLGLDMQPSKLISTLRKTFLVTLASPLVFVILGYSTGLLFGFSQIESLVIGFSLIFSSTIIGIKLLPTTVLHQKHMES